MPPRSADEEHVMERRCRYLLALLAAALLATVAQAACGGGQTRGGPLDDQRRYSSAQQVQEFLAGWRPSRQAERPGVAVGLVDTSTLVGLDLATGSRWRVERELRSRPTIAGDLVIGLGGGKLFALHAESGELAWERPAVGTLRGASDDGEMTLVSLASLSGRRTTLLAVNRAGGVVRQLNTEGVLGVPALLDGVAFVPLREHAMLLLDLVDGYDHVRIAASQPVSHAIVVGQRVYMGQQQALRIDETLAKQPTQPGHWVRLPRRIGLPAASWLLPSNATLPPYATDYDMARYYAQLRESPAGLLHAAQVQGPIAVGLTPANAATRWVATARGSFIGGSTGARTLALCDSSGEVRWLDPVSGAEQGRASLGEALVGCVVDSQRPPSGAVTKLPPLHAQLARALQHPARRAIPMQLALLEDLARQRNAASARVLRQLAEPPPGADRQRLNLAAAAAEWQQWRERKFAPTRALPDNN